MPLPSLHPHRPSARHALSTALIALVIGVPLESLGIAVYLTELAPPWFKQPVATAVELLAAVPSIIYGMWGLFVFVPLFAAYVQIPLSNIVEGCRSSARCSIRARPRARHPHRRLHPGLHDHALHRLDHARHAGADPLGAARSAYGIGATTWEVVRHVLVPQAGVSIIGAIMLGLGRALGETMAVTFVVGNANRLSASIMDPGSTIASRIANEFNEAMGLQLNALIALGCILFFVTFVVLVIARILVSRVKSY
jgi:phosphate transport system permease protein